MIFYVLREALTLNSEGIYKTIPAGGDGAELSTAALQMACQFECALVRKELAARHDAAAAHPQMRILRERDLLHWPDFPRRLGREREAGTAAPPLSVQLQQLRAAQPDKQHFRIALVNAFGTNLGDNLMGASALRAVTAVLTAGLPSFALDALFSLGANRASQAFLQTVAGVEQVFFGGISLAEFGRYDAYFDFSELLLAPRYHELPAVDFYLWSMGLDPASVAAADKRNVLSVDPAAWSAVTPLLAGATGPTVFFSFRASLALRSMDPASARQLALGLLEVAPALTLVIDTALELDHPRLRKLDGAIDSVDKLKALVAQVDGVIAVDSLAQHLSDACATPTLLLAATLPADRYPYYPHMDALTPPGAERLPGWGKVKVAEAQWQAMAGDYAAMWSALDAGAVWQRLRQRMSARAAALAGAPARHTVAQLPEPAWLRQQRGADGRLQLLPRYQVADRLALDERIARLTAAILRPGMTVVQAGAATGTLTLRLARQILPGGNMHAFEPRQPYFLTLCANAALAGVAVQAYPEAPRAGPAPLCHALDPYSSHDPMQCGNTPALVSWRTRSIDSLALEACHLLLVQAPLDLAAVLAGASATLAARRPVLLAVPLTELAGSAALAGLAYVRWRTQIGMGGDGRPRFVLVALPRESRICMEGFERIDDEVQHAQ